MNKFELWRQRRREQRVGEATVPDELPKEMLNELPDADADAALKAAGLEHGADHEDTVPAAFYRNIG